METITYSKLRRKLKASLDQVCADHTPLTVTRRSGEPVVLMSLVEYGGFAETLHLLSDPVNAERLRNSIAQAEAGLLVEHEIKPHGK